MIAMCRYCEQSEDRGGYGLYCYRWAATVGRDDPDCGEFARAPGADDDLGELSATGRRFVDGRGVVYREYSVSLAHIAREGRK